MIPAKYEVTFAKDLEKIIEKKSKIIINNLCKEIKKTSEEFQSL